MADFTTKDVIGKPPSSLAVEPQMAEFVPWLIQGEAVHSILVASIAQF